MDWILNIIKNLMDDTGEFDLEKLSDELDAAAPKYVVPKHKYNEMSDRLKEANKVIESAGSDDNSELETQLAELATAYEKQAIYYAKRDALVEAGASNEDIDFLMWKLGDEFELNEEGEVEGISEAVKSIQENNAKYFSEAEPGDGKADGKGDGKDGKADDKKPGQAGWQPIDNKLESGKTPSDKAPSTLREAIAEHYSKDAE